MSRTLAAALATVVLVAALCAWPGEKTDGAAPGGSSSLLARDGTAPGDASSTSLRAGPGSAPTPPTAPPPANLAAEDLADVDGLRDRRRARFAADAALEAERLLAQADEEALDADLLVQARAAAAALRDPSQPVPR